MDHKEDWKNTNILRVKINYNKRLFVESWFINSKSNAINERAVVVTFWSIKNYFIVIEYFRLRPCQLNNLNSYNFLKLVILIGIF